MTKNTIYSLALFMLTTSKLFCGNLPTKTDYNCAKALSSVVTTAKRNYFKKFFTDVFYFPINQLRLRRMGLIEIPDSFGYYHGQISVADKSNISTATQREIFKINQLGIRVSYSWTGEKTVEVKVADDGSIAYVLVPEELMKYPVKFEQAISGVSAKIVKLKQLKNLGLQASVEDISQDLLKFMIIGADKHSTNAVAKLIRNKFSSLKNHNISIAIDEGQKSASSLILESDNRSTIILNYETFKNDDELLKQLYMNYVLIRNTRNCYLTGDCAKTIYITKFENSSLGLVKELQVNYRTDEVDALVEFAYYKAKNTNDDLDRTEILNTFKTAKLSVHKNRIEQIEIFKDLVKHLSIFSYNLEQKNFIFRTDYNTHTVFVKFKHLKGKFKTGDNIKGFYINILEQRIKQLERSIKQQPS